LKSQLRQSHSLAPNRTFHSSFRHKYSNPEKQIRANHEDYQLKNMSHDTSALERLAFLSSRQKGQSFKSPQPEIITPRKKEADEEDQVQGRLSNLKIRTNIDDNYEIHSTSSIDRNGEEAINNFLSTYDKEYSLFFERLDRIRKSTRGAERFQSTLQRAEIPDSSRIIRNVKSERSFKSDHAPTD